MASLRMLATNDDLRDVAVVVPDQVSKNLCTISPRTGQPETHSSRSKALDEACDVWLPHQ